jgi:hypothetical protein
METVKRGIPLLEMSKFFFRFNSSPFISRRLYAAEPMTAFNFFIPLTKHMEYTIVFVMRHWGSYDRPVIWSFSYISDWVKFSFFQYEWKSSGVCQELSSILVWHCPSQGFVRLCEMCTLHFSCKLKLKRQRRCVLRLKFTDWLLLRIIVQNALYFTGIKELIPLR